jgi:hypothetical protein
MAGVGRQDRLKGRRLTITGRKLTIIWAVCVAFITIAMAAPSALANASPAQEIAAETAQEAAEEAAESAEDSAAAPAYDELELLNPRHAHQIEHLKELIARYRADLKVVRRLPHMTKRWIEHRPRKMLHIKECRERIAELRSLAPWRQ